MFFEKFNTTTIGTSTMGCFGGGSDEPKPAVVQETTPEPDSVPTPPPKEEPKIQQGVVYYIDDHLGNTHLMTDSQGKVLHEEFRYAFGLVRSSDGSCIVDYVYTGKEVDTETGLVYFGRRYYYPEAGRFLQLDPLGLARMVGGEQYSYYRHNGVLGYDDIQIPNNKIEYISEISSGVPGYPYVIIYHEGNRITVLETVPVGLKQLGEGAVVGALSLGAAYGGIVYGSGIALTAANVCLTNPVTCTDVVVGTIGGVLGGLGYSTGLPTNSYYRAISTYFVGRPIGQQIRSLLDDKNYSSNNPRYDFEVTGFDRKSGIFRIKDKSSREIKK